MKNYLLGLAVITATAMATACSQTGTAPTANSSTINTASNSTNTKTETNSASTSQANSTTATAADIAGTYTVSGSNPDGGKPYQGTLTVTKRDSVYQFSWNAGTEYDGVGVQKGNTVAVAYADGTNGKGCGAVIYEIGKDSALDGKFGEWGFNDAGTEKGTLIDGNGFVGNFDVTGTNLDGKPYKGKLVIKKDADEIHQLSWDVGAKYIGTGIKQGNYLAAGSGPKECGFVIYEVSGSTLTGKWGVPGTTKLGTEKATKK